MNHWSSTARELSNASPAERTVLLRQWLRSSAVEPEPCSKAGARPDYSEAWARVLDHTVPMAALARDERAQAPDLLKTLLAMPEANRVPAARNTPEFQTWALARLLAETSLRTIHESPAEAVGLAELALVLAEYAPSLSSALRNDLLTLCYSHLGMAQGAASRFAEAKQSLRKAEECYSASLRDPARFGFLLAMKAALAADHSEFSDSLRLSRRAGQAFRLVGDALSEGRALSQEANALFYLGRTAEAIPRLDQAAALIEAAQEPRLSFALQIHRAAYLIDLEAFAEARRSVTRARSLLRTARGRFDRIRLDWVEAELDSALGHYAAAEQRFIKVRETFLAENLSHEFAIVTLELALVLARLGRFAEAKQAAREALPILKSLGIEPEAVMAIRLYVESSAAEAAQIAVLNDLVRKLKRWTPAVGGRPTS